MTTNGGFEPCHGLRLFRRAFRHMGDGRIQSHSIPLDESRYLARHVLNSDLDLSASRHGSSGCGTTKAVVNRVGWSDRGPMVPSLSQSEPIRTAN